MSESVAIDPDADFDPFAGGALARVGPSSEGQREVWLADSQGIEASLAFNEAVELRLDGPLDVAALRAAFSVVAGRHEALRTTFSSDGCERLIADTSAAVCDWHADDAPGAMPPAVALAAARKRAVTTPFDLAQGPLLRAELHRLGADAHVLLMAAHHIVCDGWSWGVLSFDLAAEYARQKGQGRPAAAATESYGEYVDWSTEHRRSPEAQADERFWLERLAGPSLPVLDLPTDRQRPPVRTFASRRVDHLLPSDLVAALRGFGRQAGVSEFATLLAGFAATLQRITAQDDFVIGVPTAGQLASGLTGVVGHCVNLLPMRVAVDGTSPFQRHVAATSAMLLDCLDHQAVTYGTLLSQLPIPRDAGRLPLLSVMFNVDQADSRLPSAFVGLRAELSSVPRVAENFELFVNAVPAGDSYRLECQFNTALFDEASVQGWMRVFETLLRSAIAQPQQALRELACVSSVDLASLAQWQGGLRPLSPPGLMHGDIVRQCAATPGRTALSMNGRGLTYAELDGQSNRVAQALRRRGIRRGDHVGLCLPRGPLMVVAMLAVNKSGAVYVPLDPGFPAARLAYYAEDAELALLITQPDVPTAPTAWRADASDRILDIGAALADPTASADALAPRADDAQPEDAAYAIYTSGSTGKPKGVSVPHRAVANFLATMREAPGLAADARLAAVTTLSFDIAVLELLLPLTVGAEVVIVERETAMDGNALRTLLERSRITAMQGTPGIWRLLLDAGWRAPAGFTALIGGESVPVDLALELTSQGAALWNMYGPTETTVWSTVWWVERDALQRRGMSIGRPIANTQVWVLDEQLQPCPPGVPGEVCIGGSGVALGYLKRPELTAERFVTVPGLPALAGAGARVYRTGDRGRWRHDGLLEHLGRLDFQVKLRGYRIELGEIEAACCAVAGASQCVAMLREDVPGDVRLVAYLVAAPGVRDDVRLLRNELRLQLPDYMIPRHMVVLEALPLLPNGKIDRRALPEPAYAVGGASVADNATVTPLEAQVRLAMEETLRLPGIGLNDDFFSLGGHSLLAARLASRLNREFGLRLTLRALFEAPTVKRLAAVVASAKAVPESAVAAGIRHRPDRHTAPLTPMQESMRFVEELYPGTVAYNTPSAHRLVGPLETSAFERALAVVCERQASLRTRVAPNADGRYQQEIVDAIDVHLPLIDLSDLAEPERETSLHEHMAAVIDRPLSIDRAPLFHAALYRLAPQEHVFLFVPHHIVWDGWSFDIFYDEIAASYSAQVQPGSRELDPLPVTYGDFAEWYEQWLASDGADRQRLYWKGRFAGLAAPPAIPTDRPRSAGAVGDGAVAPIDTGASLAEAVRQTARNASVSVSSLAMAVVAMLISGLTGAHGVVLGLPVRGRGVGNVDGVMGLFTNVLPLPIDVAPERPVIDLLHAIQHEMIGTMANQDIPFEVLAAQPEVAAAASASGAYQASFSFQDFRERRTAWGPLQHSRIDVVQRGVTQELGFWLADTAAGIIGAATYKTDVFSAATGEALRDRFTELLALVCERPEASIAEVLAAPSAAAGHLASLRSTSASAHADRSAVQEKARAASRELTSASLAPHEAKLATIWAQLLGIRVSDIRATDSFFDLGGDSLLAMRAVEAVHSATGVRVHARSYIYDNLERIAATVAAGPTSVPRAEPDVEPGLIGRLAGVFGRRGRR